MKGKAYVNRKDLYLRPESDYYPTPKSLTRELIKLGILKEGEVIYEPASGEGAISSVLEDHGFAVFCDDLRTTGKDFLECEEKFPVIVTNPPFSLFDDFVMKAKELAPKVIFIAKTNFFGAYKRSQSGVWDNLKDVYIFNRQVDYRTPLREDGLFHVGNLITGWFVWDTEWKESYWRTHIIDVQEYAKLGQVK